MPNKYDVIVIGAGNGGLLAAAECAKKGLKTLLLERHNLPGGSASSFVRGRFEFEPSLHELANVGPEDHPGGTRDIFKEIDAEVDWRTEDTLYRVITTDDGHIDARMPVGVEAFCDAVEKAVPGSRESVHRVFECAANNNKALEYMSSGNMKLTTMLKDYSDLFRTISGTTKECLDALGVPPKAQTIISTYWPYVGAPINDLDFMTFLRMLNVYVEYGPGVPAMKSHELSLSIANSIYEYGGDIWYNCEVTKLLVRDGAAYGVVAAGKEIYADHVICNAFPNAVYGSMLDPSQVTEEEKKEVNARTPGLSFVTMYVGLNKPYQELGIEDYSIFIYDSSDPVQQFKNCHNSLGGDGWVIVNCLNKMVPEATPEGTCSLFFTTSVYGDLWGSIKPENYKKEKEKLAAKMFKIYENAVGIDVKPYIEEISIATPATMTRYLNTPNGTPYGYQVSKKDSIFGRVIMSRTQKELPIKGLRYCGVNTLVDGYNSGYMCGQAAAKKTIEDIEGEA